MAGFAAMVASFLQRRLMGAGRVAALSSMLIATATSVASAHARVLRQLANG
jgi:NaMN:DMB phosphoribosyltransferase